MSRWTHIKGVLELDASPYELKKSVSKPKLSDYKPEEFKEALDKYRKKVRRLIYLPYPEEQFKLSPALPSVSWGKKKSDGTYEKFHTIEFEAYIYSLPRARKYIEEAFLLMPQGESRLRYSLDQKSCDHRSSSSCFDFNCEKEAYKAAINKMYSFDDPWQSNDYNSLRSIYKIDDECTKHSVNSIIVGVRDDIRWCDGVSLMAGLKQALDYMEKHEIRPEEGYLEWRDEYLPEYRFYWRIENWVQEYSIVNLKENKTVYSYQVEKDINADTYEFEEKVSETKDPEFKMFDSMESLIKKVREKDDDY